MADYDPERWLARQLAWENTLERLRAEAGIALPDKARSTPKRTKKRAHGADLPMPNKAA